MADSPPGISAIPHDDNLRYFDVIIAGPDGSPFEGEHEHMAGLEARVQSWLTRNESQLIGGQFKLELFLPEDYPMAPPKVRFLTKIYHPNIGQSAIRDSDHFAPGRSRRQPRPGRAPTPPTPLRPANPFLTLATPQTSWVGSASTSSRTSGHPRSRSAPSSSRSRRSSARPTPYVATTLPLRLHSGPSTCPWPSH